MRYEMRQEGICNDRIPKEKTHKPDFCMYYALDPLRDEQEAPAVGNCRRCGGELYGDEEELCTACREVLERCDTGTVLRMLEEVSWQMELHGVDRRVRDAIWSALVRDFLWESGG